MSDWPFLSKYDPPGSGEGSLDPLGLYLLADQLAVTLVPAVRERMQRVRFLTAMTVGAYVTEGLEAPLKHPEVPAFQAWEWLVVEAIIRTFPDDDDMWAVPGSSLTRKAVDEYGYVDYRSYLKTPRVFGFHGVYKRLAVHLGLADTDLRLRERNGERLIQAWAMDRGWSRFDHSHEFFSKWREAVDLSLRQDPPRTRTHWSKEDWGGLAEAFAPNAAKRREKTYLKELLLKPSGEDALGAFRYLWDMCPDMDGDNINERKIHQRLVKVAPQYTVLIEAIQSYERFARVLTDGFDLLRYEAGERDMEGFAITDLAKNQVFQRLASQLHDAFVGAVKGLTELQKDVVFSERFKRFSDPLPPPIFAEQLCEHHETIQGDKSREGKRPWFDRMGGKRIYLRHSYRIDKKPRHSDSYVHDYRAVPTHRFYTDLT